MIAPCGHIIPIPSFKVQDYVEPSNIFLRQASCNARGRIQGKTWRIASGSRKRAVAFGNDARASYNPAI